MHGYIDTISVPLHLPPSAFKPATASSTSNAKGKQKAHNQDQVTPSSTAAYDVVANWTPADRLEVEKMVQMASLLGYSTVVLDISIPPTFDPSLLSFPTPLFPSLDPRTATPGTPNLALQLWRITIENYSDEAVKGAGQKGWYGFANSTAPLYPQQTTLLSVVPTTLASFSHVALSLSPPSAHAPTLISIDPSLSPRLPFPLKRGLISTLSRFGVSFELVLRGLTRQDSGGGGGEGDSGKRRRNWISGAREIVRATQGKGVVISSGAKCAHEMRASQDLINLCSLIGMPANQAKDALTVNPQRSILRGLSMRSTYRGVFSNPTLTASDTTKASVVQMDIEKESPTTTMGGKKRSSGQPTTKETTSESAKRPEQNGTEGSAGKGKKRKL
ncbi:RNA-binding RNA processing protein RPP1 [Sporobolomyces koalae]|uniref:RNA-binding RNA processing protein RPP1 n=1 Tax=Sporobolomyces koalae TaxID=500713 RepID=UPI00317BFA8A